MLHQQMQQTKIIERNEWVYSEFRAKKGNGTITQRDSTELAAVRTWIRISVMAGSRCLSSSKQKQAPL